MKTESDRHRIATDITRLHGGLINRLNGHEKIDNEEDKRHEN